MELVGTRSMASKHTSLSAWILSESIFPYLVMRRHNEGALALDALRYAA